MWKFITFVSLVSLMAMKSFSTPTLTTATLSLGLAGVFAVGLLALTRQFIDEMVEG